MGRPPSKVGELFSALSEFAWVDSRSAGGAAGMSSWAAAQTMAKYRSFFERKRVKDPDGNWRFLYRRRSR